mmetsp:Transcript_1608/g.1750  ORF Transcript_1608/g.1750 Transcript_1608/m.1750 type:complete len:210 (-) Transcript_1608:125-754(-)
MTMKATIEAGGGEDEQAISNDDRWALIWSALIIYWAIDALTIFVIALASLIASIIFMAATAASNDEKPCKIAGIMFILSLIIFLTRFIDMVLGCCTIGCWFCRNKTDTDGREMIPHIRNCIIIGTTQALLSLANIVLGIVGLTSEGTACAGSVVTIVFAVLLIMDAGFEMFIWIGAYFIRINQDKAPIPPIVDKIIPNCLARWARRTRL